MTLNEYKQKYYASLDDGEPKRNGIRQALDAALEQQDWHGAFELYYEFMHQDVIHCDSFQATIVFPEYVALFEQHPEYHDEFNHDLMWSYKWVLANFKDFWQIPKEQIVSIYKHYYDFCTRFGYSKRTYYQCLWDLLYVHGLEDCFDVGGVKACHEKMLQCADDSMSDCPACELNDYVAYILRVEKDIEKALKKAYPILAEKKSCAEIPHTTYTLFASAYLEQGNLIEAKKYADLGWRIINRDFGNEMVLISAKSKCMLVYAFTNTALGMKLFKKLFIFIPKIKDAVANFDFYRNSYHLFNQLEKQGHKTVTMAFPFRDNPLYNEKGVYKASQMKAFLYKQAKFYADKLDTRNGNSRFNDRLAQVYDLEWDLVKAEEDFQIPVLTYIRDCMDENGTLPQNFVLPKPDKLPEDENNPDSKNIYIAEGALDGIMLYHTELPEEDLNDEFQSYIQMASEGRGRFTAAKIEKYFRRTNIRMLTMYDALQNYLSDNRNELSPEQMYNLAVVLITQAKHKEAVKCGLSILEMLNTANEALQEAVVDLARSEEFAFFAVRVIQNFKNSNERLFEVAKQLKGWGRIHAVHYLEATTDEMKLWLFTEGYKNNIHYGYSLCDCFVKSGVPELLKGDLTEEELEVIGQFIEMLMEDGPIGNIYALDNAEEILYDYRQHLD